MVHHEYRPLIHREPAEGSFEFVAIHYRTGCIRGRRPEIGQDADVGCPRAIPTDLDLTGIDEDAMEPGLDAIDISQMRKLPPRADEGALQCVLGEARVAKDPEGDRVQPVADLMHQAGEGVTIALAGSHHEVSIHLGLHLSRLIGAIWNV